MFIPDPDFYPSRISKEEGGNVFLSYHFIRHKYKVVNNFIIEQVKKIFVTKTLKIVVLFTQKFLIKLSKIWVWDPRSGIPDQEKKPVPYPGFRVKKAPYPGFGSGKLMRIRRDPGPTTLIEANADLKHCRSTGICFHKSPKL